MEQTHNKLVRDKIPEFLEKRWIKSKTKKVKWKEKLQTLEDKLEEEVDELLESKTREEKVWEFADIFEVLYALAEENNISLEKIENFRKAKLKERGSFEKWVFLISTWE